MSADVFGGQHNKKLVMGHGFVCPIHSSVLQSSSRSAFISAASSARLSLLVRVSRTRRCRFTASLVHKGEGDGLKRTGEAESALGLENEGLSQPSSVTEDTLEQAALPVENVSKDRRLWGFSEWKAALAGILGWIWSGLRKAAAPGGFLWGFGAGAVIVIGVVFWPWADDGGVLRQKVALFDYILQDIDKSYVDKVDVDKLFETGMNSMLGSLDPYCEFKSTAGAFEMNLKTNGEYAGVGLGISTSDDIPDDKMAIDAIRSGARDDSTELPPLSDTKELDPAPLRTDGIVIRKEEMKAKPLPRIVVVAAFEGYAFDAGVRPGDVVLSVDNTPTTGMSLEAVTQLLRGEPGTSVELTVTRRGYSHPLSFTLHRRNVQLKDVPVSTYLDADSSIGYIRVQSFSKDAGREVRDAVANLQDSRSKLEHPLTGLVIDLRNNPGGLLTSAVEVAETLLPKNSLIVSTQGRGIGRSYRSTEEPEVDPATRIAILVNGETASASEVVAGAVQDLDAGIIIGSRTFGKGLVQNLQELPYQTAVKYTVGKYYTPSGRCIQAINYESGAAGYTTRKVEEQARKEFKTASGRTVRDGGGIEPDVTVPRVPSLLERALQVQNMYFFYAGKYAASLGTGVETLPKDFAITDDIYNDFAKFVSSSPNFKYESRFDDAFTQLEGMFSEHGYEGAKGKVGELKQVTENEMRADFKRHEKQVRAQLESAIRYRFQPDSERLKAELKTDDQVKEAVEVLKDQRVYDGLLRPRKVTLVEMEGQEGLDIMAGRDNQKSSAERRD